MHNRRAGAQAGEAPCGRAATASRATRVVFALAAWTAVAAAASAQDGTFPAGFPFQDPWWKDKTITEIRGDGFATRPFDTLLRDRLPLREGFRLTPELMDRTIEELQRTGWFELASLRVEPLRDPANPDGVIVVVHVRELQTADEVVLEGVEEGDLNQIRNLLSIARAGDPIDPYKLHVDRGRIERWYKDEGFHFVEVSHEIQPAAGGRARLVWHILEGPRVSVDDIIFHGFIPVDEDVLKTAMGTRESRLFSKTRFVERRLELDLTRLKVLLAQYGYLDAPRGETVYLRDLEFTPDRTWVDIHIQIEETPLYRIGEIVVEGNKVLSTEQILSKVRLKPGDPCRDITLMEDLREIRNLYAERSYILATVDSRWEAMAEPHTMRLRLRIEERDPAVVGFVEFRAVRRRDDGTVEPVLQRRTRDDVLRRELRSFAPGEPFDGTALDRGIQRLRDTGWFEPDISYDITPGRIEGTRDVTIYVQERQTGTFRLLGGYSSAFGIVGVLEFTQQNFDIARLPRSLDELVRGEAFVGGGQYFNIRFMPGQRREQFSVAFREPYIFGLDYGGGFSFFRTLTNRESWDEFTLGGGVFLDRRWGDLRVALNAQAESLDIKNVDADAPAIVRRLEGNNTTIQIGPSVRYDARDSVQLATEGFLVEGQLWLSSQAIGSDFNFWKVRIEYEHLFPVYEPEERNRMRRHVLSVRGTLGLADTFAGDDSVPFFERFFAGGRGSMRGFAFRGMGPHEGDDPTGGQMLVLGSIEYSLPLYEDFLRLAVFTDVGNLAGKIRELGEDKWRVTVGVGLRALVPFLSQTPVALDFGFALVREDFDDEQIITFDIGRLF